MLGVALLLGACAPPIGAPVPACGPDWEPDAMRLAAEPTRQSRLVPFECWREMADRRLEIGLVLPPGPECYAVNRVELLEAPDAISASVFIGVELSPLAGACPPEEQTVAVELQLREPVGDRPILDGARSAD